MLSLNSQELYLDSGKLAALRRKHRGQRIVFVSGCFDLTHAGHIIFFEQAHLEGDILVVAVADDELMRAYKGERRPILNELARWKMVSSLKAVDYCFLCGPLHDLSVLLEREVFPFLRPDSYVWQNDTWSTEYRTEAARRFGVTPVVLDRFIESPFIELSTTSIIEKVMALKQEKGETP